MTLAEFFSIAIGVLNLGVVGAIALHLRGLGLRPPAPLVVLAVVFGIRGVARLVPGDDLDLLLDAVLSLVLIAFLLTARRLVGTFLHERDAMQRAQVDYDEALFRHEATVAASSRSELDRLARAVDELAVSAGDQGDAAATEARDAIAVLRARPGVEPADE